MRSLARVFACAALLSAFSLAVPASSAFAECNPDNAIFEDDFEFLDASWGDADDAFDVEDGVLLVKGYRSQVNFATQNDGADVCIDITIADAAEPMNSPAGMIFWWADWDNYYYFFYWPDGGIEARRIFKGKVSTIFSTETLAIKKGVGATNQVELKLKPRDATIIFNGTQVKRFKGVQPKDGGVIGIIATSPEGAPAAFKFDNLVVSTPE
jgi:hypothetical protein